MDAILDRAAAAPPVAEGAETDDGPVGVITREAVTAKIAVTPLRGGVSVLSGSGGNIAVLVGPDGKAMLPPASPCRAPGSRPPWTASAAARCGT